METIKLADDKSYVTITELPNELGNKLRDNFDKLFNYHPANRGVVIMSDLTNKVSDIVCSRWFQSYLKTPKWDPSLPHSYMFSGQNPIPQPELTEEFKEVLDWVNANEKKYNQVVVNWYADGGDYIPYHSDYEYNAVPEYGIVVVNITKYDNILRTFKLKPKANLLPDAVDVNIPLSHKKVITMHGKTQTYYRHGVPPVTSINADPGPRISLIFRAFY